MCCETAAPRPVSRSCILQQATRPPGPFTVAKLTTFNLDHDAAIAEFEPNIGASNDTRHTAITIGSPQWTAEGDILELDGRTTPTAQGIVSNVGLLEGIYPAMTLRPLPGHTLPITKGGDSGAIWYDIKTTAAKGLHLGFKDDTGESLAVMLPAVLKEMPGGPLTW